MTKNKTIRLASTLMVINTIMTGAFLSSSVVKADNTNVVDKINITVPISCTMSGTGMNTHNATINNGQYNSNIGETTLKAFCNDNEGFAIYAIGYTDNLNGKNVLTNSTLGNTYDIATGTATSGNTSNWAMKLTTVSDPVPTYPITIQNSFDSFHAVPDTYTLVAKRTAGTDIGQAAEGSTLKTTYQAYIAQTQAAGTYTGQVKYTLIHPHDEPTPPSSMLLTGEVVNARMKSLAAGASKAFTDQDNSIKAIKMANSLPANFEATEANTVSTPDSKYPIYIFFDNANDAGILYFYTDNDRVVLNPDSGNLIRFFNALTDISGLSTWDSSWVESLYMAFCQNKALTSLSSLSNWDTSKVTNMSRAFSVNNLTTLDGLENMDTSHVTDMSQVFVGNVALVDATAIEHWDTSNVTNMSQAFRMEYALTQLDLSNWDTSKVTDMSSLFLESIALTQLDLSSWDTSSVTNMSGLFASAKSLISIDVSGWNTSNVTTMSNMFSVGESYAGNGQLSEIIGLENWDVSNVRDMGWMFYGAGKMTHYDIENWDVSKVESFNHMFTDNRKLESLDLSKWDVSSVKTMYDMFDDNYKLTTIGDVSHWNTVSLIDVGGWLNGATSFVGDNGTLDLSGWNTSNLKSTNEMFRATKLETIDLSGWTFDAITNSSWEGAGSGIYYEYSTAMGTMFKDTAQLNTVYLSQLGLDSFNAAVNRGVRTTDMWTGSGASGFTVKP